jgi:type IV pilus assembly protein PilM
MSSLLGILGGSQLGLDVGQSAVKICGLSKAGKGVFSLSSFAFTLLSESAIFEEEVSNKPEVVEAIKNAMKVGKFKGKDFCFGLSGSSCVVKTMKAPDGSNDEIEDFISWEAEQFIPFGLENSEISMHVMDGVKDGNKDVIMAAAKLSSIELFTDLVRTAGFRLKTFDLQVLSLINVFEYNYIDNLHAYKSGSLIIDFGAQSTKVIVYKDGVPLLTKSILMGGVNATEEIQKSIGLDFSEAEDLKQTRSDDGNHPEEVVKSVNGIVDAILNKIIDAVTFYTRTGSEDKIKHCFVTGGSLQLPGIFEGLADRLDLSVEVLDPLRRVKVGRKINPAVIEYITYCGAVPLGLAMRNFD